MSFIWLTPFADEQTKMALSAHHIIAVQSHGDDGKTEVLMTGSGDTSAPSPPQRKPTPPTSRPHDNFTRSAPYD